MQESGRLGSTLAGLLGVETVVLACDLGESKGLKLMSVGSSTRRDLVPFLTRTVLFLLLWGRLKGEGGGSSEGRPKVWNSKFNFARLKRNKCTGLQIPLIYFCVSIKKSSVFLEALKGVAEAESRRGTEVFHRNWRAVGESFQGCEWGLVRESEGERW